RHERLWERMGAHLKHYRDVSGVSFAVWAPNARGVSVVGDFNSWDGRLHAMRSMGASGIWSCSFPKSARELDTSSRFAPSKARPSSSRPRSHSEPSFPR